MNRFTPRAKPTAADHEQRLMLALHQMSDDAVLRATVAAGCVTPMGDRR